MSPVAVQVERKRAVRILQPASGYLEGFTHSVNPYIGCGYGRPVDNPGGVPMGCPYCYVRRLPVSLTRPASWGTWVIAKEGAAEQLRQEIRRWRRSGRGALNIFLGSSTDPYQPVEGRLLITREILAVMAEEEVDRVLLQTRSPMVLRDVDLLRRLGERIRVSMTIETDDDRVRRRITPTSPPVSARIRALYRLRAANVPTQAAVSPALPMNPERLARLLAEAADRVVLDTFHLGDGSGGRRSKSLGMSEWLQKLGYGEWFDPDLHRRLLPVFLEAAGPGRVGLGPSGFAGIPVDS
ncbi:MAG: radical SAM protein [Alicyclobacillaceae bacterium]|nr:radical SAM protein [Alicyclobacillaceae bacterium]